MVIPYKPKPISTPHIEATVTTGPQGGTSYQSKLYYTHEGDSIDFAMLGQIADGLWNHIGASWRGVLQPGIYFFPISCRYLTSGEDIEATSSFSATEGQLSAVSGSNDFLPEDDNVVIQRRTFKRGRNMRGRIFIPFVPEDLAVNSTLNSLGLTKYKELAGKLSDVITISQAGTITPGTPNGKQGLLETVGQCRVVSEIMSRRDRRFPRRPVAFPAPRQYA
jgi:hypothetical protein